MNLREIVVEFLEVARRIEYDELSYGLKPLVKIGRKSNPADILTKIAARFTADITHDVKPSKQKLESALREFKNIAKDYGIEQLRKPIKDLSAFIDNSSEMV